VTFEAIEAADVEAFLTKLREELVQWTYRPLPLQRVGIPKEEMARAICPFLPSATGWSREPSSSSWNRSSRPTFNRDRMAIVLRGLHTRRSKRLGCTGTWCVPVRPR
jgi:hypothetical protein